MLILIRFVGNLKKIFIQFVLDLNEQLGCNDLDDYELSRLLYLL